MKKSATIVGFVLIAAGIIALGSWYAGTISGATANTTAAQITAAQDAQSKIMQNLKIKDVVAGTGAEAENGDLVTVNYVGTLDNGTKFDSSYDRHQPFSFTLGAAEVIKGWDLGVLGMKVGGTRDLTIPPELGYGDRQVATIPPNSTLHFMVELLSVQAPTSTSGQ